ncbi:MAG: hypothetical protein IJ165_07270 [Proteobacteria bacterium]|nr:hypothetical protein [Pseudomonadota bacterium]
METIEPVAHSISTYGLYAIIAILCFVVVYLYKRVGDLEKEIRNLLAAKAADAAEMAKANAQMIEVLKDNTAAFNNFQTTLSEIKTTIQMSMDRKP